MHTSMVMLWYTCAKYTVPSLLLIEWSNVYSYYLQHVVVELVNPFFTSIRRMRCMNIVSFAHVAHIMLFGFNPSYNFFNTRCMIQFFLCFYRDFLSFIIHDLFLSFLVTIIAFELKLLLKSYPVTSTIYSHLFVHLCL